MRRWGRHLLSKVSAFKEDYVICLRHHPNLCLRHQPKWFGRSWFLLAGPLDTDRWYPLAYSGGSRHRKARNLHLFSQSCHSIASHYPPTPLLFSWWDLTTSTAAARSPAFLTTAMYIGQKRGHVCSHGTANPLVLYKSSRTALRWPVRFINTVLGRICT